MRGRLGRAFAGARPARHRLPEDVVVLRALPPTAAGKVDRRALERRIGSP